MFGVQYLVFGVRSWRSAVPSDDGCIQAIHNTTFSPFITTHPDDIAFLSPWGYGLVLVIRRKHEEYEGAILFFNCGVLFEIDVILKIFSLFYVGWKAKFSFSSDTPLIVECHVRCLLFCIILVG